VALDPQYAVAWAALGSAYGLKGEFLSIPELNDKSIDVLRRALEIDPGVPSAHGWLGSALMNAGQLDEAVVVLEEAVRLDPGNASARGTLARAHWIGRGDFERGIEELEHAVRLNPRSGYGFLQLSLLYALRGRYDRAEAAARQAIELQEQYISGQQGMLIVGAHGRLGYALHRQGRHDEAIREYEAELRFISASDHMLRDRTTIELNQKLGAAYLAKGETETAERHFALALKAFERRVASGADDGFTRYYVACVHALRGDADAACRSLDAAARTLPALTSARAAIDPAFDGVREEDCFRRFEPRGSDTTGSTR
jgi:tetratricopeptide (TPR) repeat protein